MSHLTLPMLELLVRLRRTRSARLPVDEVDVGTARALVHRGFARWDTDKSTAGWPVELVLQPKGRMTISRALAAGATFGRAA